LGQKKSKVIKIAVGVFLLAIACLSISFANSDASVFLLHYFRNPSNIGSVVPSSSVVCEEITRDLRANRPPYRILEVGAGTGVITQEIAQCLQPGDVFDVVEIDSDFCELIKSKVHPSEQITVRCLSITDWHPDYQYDVIISTLPFNSLTPTLVHEVLDSYSNLLTPQGRLAYIEYIGLSDIKKFFLFGNSLKEFLEIEREIKAFQKSSCYGQHTVQVWQNFPPAHVYHLRVNP
jgi:phosphatidylserine decarboxylase